jgi:hypothetical protein
MFLFFYLLKHLPGNDGKIYIMPTMLIALGGYGFYRIPLDYKIHVIRSRATPDEKKAVIKEYTLHLNVKRMIEQDNYFNIVYRKYLLWPVYLRIYVLEDEILLNAHTYFEYGTRGIIDFGVGPAAANHAKDFISRVLGD